MMTTPTDILFKSLADPTRRALFEYLCRTGETNVAALTAHAGVSQPVVSRHLAVLKAAGLVMGRQDGRQTHYSAQPGALAPLNAWSREMTGVWSARLSPFADGLDVEAE